MFCRLCEKEFEVLSKWNYEFEDYAGYCCGECADEDDFEIYDEDIDGQSYVENY